jgi:opacity protein-like surface antigen
MKKPLLIIASIFLILISCSESKPANFERESFKAKLMRGTLLVLAMFHFMVIQAQDSKFSASLSYPLPIDDNSFKEYTGIVDLEVQYVFYDTGKFSFGTSLNGSYFAQRTNYINPTFTIKENIFLVQPKVLTIFKIGQAQDFRPFLGIGYALALYDIGFDVSNGPPDENVGKGGFTINSGITIEIPKQLYLIAQLDYSKFSDTEGGLNIDFSNNLTIFKLGVGYRF